MEINSIADLQRPAETGLDGRSANPDPVETAREFEALLVQCEQDLECFYEAARDLGNLPRETRDRRLDALATSETPAAGSGA